MPNKCRFCGLYGRTVRYGPRHHAHLDCGVARLGADDFVAKISTTDLENLPFIHLRRAGLLDQVKAELDRREQAWREARRKTVQRFGPPSSGGAA